MAGFHDAEVARLDSRSPSSVDPRGTSGVAGRAVVTLSSPVAARVRDMAETMGGVTNAEVVRRGLILLDLLLSLPAEEELAIRNNETGACDRVRFAWDLVSHNSHT